MMEDEEVDYATIRQSAALTIAGSDSGGNAGVQADLRAFHTFGVHGCTVFTALTAQNPFGVRDILLPDPAFVGSQIDAVLETYGVMALKTGMLAAPEIIEVVAERLSMNSRIPAIIDPVMVATSGARLLQEDAESVLKAKLLPLAYLLTPNLPEAEALADAPSADPAELARRLSDRYACSVLVKGGHSEAHPAKDYFFDGNALYRISTPVIEDPLSTHGTGCSLSAAITASAACGHTMLDAVIDGKAYVYESIRTAVHVGEVCTVLGMPKRIPVDAVRVDKV